MEIGHATHAGFVFVADGTEATEKRLIISLTDDCGPDVARYADTDYDEAIRTAKSINIQ